jgi:hypothetical protein
MEPRHAAARVDAAGEPVMAFKRSAELHCIAVTVALRVRATTGNERVYVYRFPPLAECRKQFDELMQGGIDWGSSGSGFFDFDEWEKEPPPER